MSSDHFLLLCNGRDRPFLTINPNQGWEGGGRGGVGDGWGFEHSILVCVCCMREADTSGEQQRNCADALCPTFLSLLLTMTDGDDGDYDDGSFVTSFVTDPAIHALLKSLMLNVTYFRLLSFGLLLYCTFCFCKLLRL